MAIHSYRIRARDRALNQSGLTNAVSTPTSFNPTFPRVGGMPFGNYAAGRSYVAGNGPKRCYRASVLGVQTWSGWRDAVTNQNFKQVVDTILANNPECIIVPYLNYGELDKPLVDGNPSGVDYDLAVDINTNNRFAYANGVTKTTKQNSWFGSGFYKLNYTLNAPVVAGKRYFEFFLDRQVNIMKNGLSTASNGSGGLNTNGGQVSGIKGGFIDNYFFAERPNTVISSGPQCDFDANGSLDDNTVATGWNYIRNSHRAASDYLRSIWPDGNPIVLGNIADWYNTIRFPAQYGNLTGGPYDGALNGGLLESHIGESNSLESFYSFGAAMEAYAQAMALSLDPKLVIVGGVTAGASDYALGRYITGFTSLNNGYGYLTTASQQYNVNTWMYMDEYDFNMGYPKTSGFGVVPTVAAYQAGAGGQGIWRRDFDNGLWLVGARRGSGALGSFDQNTAYGVISLPFDTWRLNPVSPQDATVNSGAKIPAGSNISMTPRTALALSYTPT